MKQLVAPFLFVLRLGLEQGTSRPVTLDQLTVSAEQLPIGCGLAPAASERAGGRHISGLWAGLPIATNPWTGTEHRASGVISERIAPSRMPDGPPLPAPELARFRDRLADGLEEAYAAIYVESGSTTLIVMYGLRFGSPQRASEFVRGARTFFGSGSWPAVVGPLVISLSGADTPCFHAVEAHLKSLAR
jgi:hypothetical protein